MNTLQVLDEDRLHILFSDNLDMVKEIYSIALNDFPNTADKLHNAIDAGLDEQIAQYAHTLKGSIVNVGGERASKIADEINAAAKNHDITRCTELFPTFMSELDAFFEAFRVYAKLEN